MPRLSTGGDDLAYRPAVVADGAAGGTPTNKAATYVAAMLDLQVWSHGLYLATRAAAHEHQHGHAD